MTESNRSVNIMRHGINAAKLRSISRTYAVNVSVDVGLWHEASCVDDDAPEKEIVVESRILDTHRFRKQLPRQAESRVLPAIRGAIVVTSVNGG